MKYFLDTEFIEGTRKTLLKSKPTIDLISIGIVSDDNREYYAISKDFNLKEAWNRHDTTPNMDYKPSFGGYSDGQFNPQFLKTYWIRDNVLKPIYDELYIKEQQYVHQALRVSCFFEEPKYDFCFKELKRLIQKFGKSNKTIAEEVFNFCSNGYHKGNSLSFSERKKYPLCGKFRPEFYGYYSDYDWVVFCWLFGKMIDLPKGFPMVCYDIKQILDEKTKSRVTKQCRLYRKQLDAVRYNDGDITEALNIVKSLPYYPIEVNKHNALGDARWNKQLYEFLKLI